jgi:ABC-type polar amino acid transport system ATPase subunit
MMRISGLRKAFAGNAVLGGIDATVAEGKIVALLGASGSGKSTLLRCLNGLETFDAGSLEIAGFSLGPGAHDARTLQALRAKVGMVFQEFHLFSHLSVLEPKRTLMSCSRKWA